MKRRSRVKIVLLALLVKFSIAQNTLGFPKSHEGQAQSLEDGDETFSVFYGPRLFKQLYYEPEVDANFKYYKIKDAGTLGLSSERMVSDLFSVGLDVLYSKANISYDQFVSGFVNGNFQQNTYNYNINVSSLCVFFRSNIHFFWIFDEKMDLYMMVSLGYRRTKFKTNTSDPGFEFNPNLYYSFGDPSFPVGGKFGFGFRYYFSEVVGANIEVGFGQPNIAAGINLRFSK